MKNVLVLFALLSMTLSAYAQKGDEILMTVGETPVTVEEFKYIYEKNNGKDANYSKESIQEYLDLYKKFKLKVEKAKALRLDTIPSLRNELKGYRDQLATSYIYDKEVLEKLVQDIYDRKKQDVHVRHIMIQKPRTSSKQKEALDRAQAVLRELKRGKRFDAVAKSMSEDKNTAPRGGELGWLTSTLPDAFYNIEVAMYELPLGKHSDIIESDHGYHIIEVMGRRPARRTMNVAHVLIKVGKEQSNAGEAKKKADAVYEGLQSGTSWQTMVNKYSEDSKTKTNNGRLPLMGISMYAREFEDAAFALKKDGDISRPVLTSIGYHIIKRIDKPIVPTYAEYVKQNKESIKKRKRYQYAQNNYLEEVRKKANFSVNRAALDTFGSTLSDEEFYSFKWKPDADMKDDLLVTMGKHKYGIKEFAEYCKKNIRRRGALGKGYPIKDGLQKLFDSYVMEKSMDYTITSVEERHPDFRSLMREYQEGILLFEITKQNVWDRANKDTIGLQAYYDQNKENYMWGKRAKVVTYTVDKKYAKKVKRYMRRAKRYSKDRMLKKYNSKKKQVLTATEEVVEITADNKMHVPFKKGLIRPTATVDKSGNPTFSVVTQAIDPTVKTLQEARGFIVADYQEKLERDWVADLHEQYPIVVNKEVLSKLIK